MSTAVTKQFTQTDPMPLGAGTAFESAYVYAGDNPAVFSDPSGMRRIPNTFGFVPSNNLSVQQPGTNMLGFLSYQSGKVLDLNPALILAYVRQEGGSRNDRGARRQGQVRCEMAALEFWDTAGDELCDTFGITNIRRSQINGVYGSKDPLVSAMVRRGGVGSSKDLARVVILDEASAVATFAASLRVLNARIPASIMTVRRSDGETVTRAELLLLNGSDGGLIDLVTARDFEANAARQTDLAKRLNDPRNREYLAVFRRPYADARKELA